MVTCQLPLLLTSVQLASTIGSPSHTVLTETGCYLPDVMDAQPVVSELTTSAVIEIMKRDEKMQVDMSASEVESRDSAMSRLMRA